MQEGTTAKDNNRTSTLCYCRVVNWTSLELCGKLENDVLTKKMNVEYGIHVKCIA